MPYCGETPESGSCHIRQVISVGAGFWLTVQSWKSQLTFEHDCYSSSKTSDQDHLGGRNMLPSRGLQHALAGQTPWALIHECQAWTLDVISRFTPAKLRSPTYGQVPYLFFLFLRGVQYNSAKSGRGPMREPLNWTLEVPFLGVETISSWSPLLCPTLQS